MNVKTSTYIYWAVIFVLLLLLSGYNLGLLSPLASNQSKFNAIFFKASELNGAIGKIDNQNRVVIGGIDKQGFITYGPYVKLQEGKYQFHMSYVSSEPINTPVGSWEVFVSLPTEGKKIKDGTIYGSHGLDRHLSGDFVIPKEFSDEKVEIKNFYNGVGNLTIKSLTIIKIEEGVK